MKREAIVHDVTWNLRSMALAALKLRRGLFERWGLTPARFDMLFAIRCQRQGWYPQRNLRELLGVGASTISRMIDSLVEIGFLRRRRVEGDARRRELSITKHGKRTLRCMFENIIGSGLARKIVGELLSNDPDGTHSTEEQRADAISSFTVVTSYFMQNLECAAQFVYGEPDSWPPPTKIFYPEDYGFDPATDQIGDTEPVLRWIARL